MLLVFSLVLLLMSASCTAGATVTDCPDAGVHDEVDSVQVLRVGGDPDAMPHLVDSTWTLGRLRVGAPLPEGYPVPTPPGVIEIKRYPSVRRAEASSDEVASDRGTDGVFMPLFRHIEERGIEMTAPVEMDYEDWSGAAGDRPGRWTMSFLYRTSDLGSTGEAGCVQVVDTEPTLVLSIGMRGSYGIEAVSRGVQALEQWLDDQDEWVRDGAPRALHYNGPSVPNRDKWSEVQLPIRGKSASPLLELQVDPGRRVPIVEWPEVDRV